ncbi:MAG: hypothetical protein EHM33_07825 [Chloroflexi bacterium]|nr:MAG: hypothetical protein EHM33_07825 [Chloroflexota bacterium]
MKQYKHTQIGYLLIIAFGIAILLIGNLMIATKFNPTVVFLLALMILCLALFATLTVEVDGQAINLRFGIGVIRKRFLLKEVEEYRAVKNPLYYAWGIHVIPDGWVFNVSGTQAVELQMRNGRKYRIGTDDVEGLTNAVKARLQTA